MTVVTRVSARTMEKRTGFKTALGYAFPKTDEILIRKGLSKKLEAKVKQHEEEHIERGEEGPGLGSFFKKIAGPVLGVVGGLIGGPTGAKIGAGLGGAISSSSAAKKATKAQTDAADQQIAFARESRDLIRGDTAPYRQAGVTALNALMSLTGLPMGGGAAVSESSDPTGGGSVRGPSWNPSSGSRLGGNNFTRWARGDMTGFNRGSQFANDYTTQRYHGGKVSRALGGSLYGGFQEPGQNAVGMAGPQQVQVGEQGPETLVGNDGSMQTVGANGPETISPQQDGTIIPAGQFGPNTGAVPENPGGQPGQYNFQTDPGYGFRIGEGMRALERSSAAKGGLLSGGFARKALRYAQDYASNEYSNVYNRISNIAGLGQVGTAQANQGSLFFGQQAGAAAGNEGFARASGYTAQGNIMSNVVNQIPWEDIFKPKASGPP